MYTLTKTEGIHTCLQSLNTVYSFAARLSLHAERYRRLIFVLFLKGKSSKNIFKVLKARFSRRYSISQNTNKCCFIYLCVLDVLLIWLSILLKKQCTKYSQETIFCTIVISHILLNALFNHHLSTWYLSYSTIAGTSFPPVETERFQWIV